METLPADIGQPVVNAVWHAHAFLVIGVGREQKPKVQDFYLKTLNSIKENSIMGQ